MSSLLSKSLGALKSQDAGAPRRTSGGGGDSRASPYSRPAPVTGAWSHDMYGSASGDRETRGDNTRSNAGGAGGQGGTEKKSEKLIVTNLHYEVSERELELLFLQIGPLASGPSIKYDKSGRSMGSAYLAYTNTADSGRAKTAFDGALAKGQNITVRFDYRPSPPAAPEPGTLAARLAQPAVQSQNQRQNNRPNPLNPLNSGTRDGARAPTSVRGGARGGRGGARGNVRGVGGAAGREGKKVAKSADDLDKELEAFMGAPAPEAPAKAAVTDVEMA